MLEFLVETKEKECFPFDERMTKLEMLAFGWADRDHVTDYYNEYAITIDWERGTASVDQKFKRYAVFKRIKPYSYNVLFRFLEVLMSIQSWIRRKLIILLWFIDAILFGIGILYIIFGAGMNEYIAYGLTVLAFIYLPSLIIAGLGFLVRKIFRLDEKLKDDLEANGYKREQNF